MPSKFELEPHKAAVEMLKTRRNSAQWMQYFETEANWTAILETQEKQKEFKQAVIKNILLSLPRASFDALLQNDDYRYRLDVLLPNYNLNNLKRQYNHEHPDALPNPSGVAMKTYQTDEGRLFQIALKNADGTERTVNFTRKYSWGSERILSAEPITLSSDEWKMFVDRGHGLYATSMITRVIGTLGQYIAQVEREYGIYPTKDPVTGNYFLSEAAQAALKARDPNAWAKYNTIQNAQDQLRSLYALEREIDPNHPELQRDFKHDVRKILDDLRGALYQQKQWTIDHMPVSSDHIVAAAHEQIIKFEWPNNGEGRRFAITEADQLLVTPGARITYDPSKEPSSAAGGSVFSTTSGFGEAGRDNFAHCITLTDGFDSKQRSALMSEVRKLKPSEGLRLEATSQKDRAKEMESKRIALAVLSKPDTLAASFKELTAVYNTPEGRKICEEKFGCDFEAFKAN